jgi:hypothetical protein
LEKNSFFWFMVTAYLNCQIRNWMARFGRAVVGKANLGNTHTRHSTISVGIFREVVVLRPLRSTTSNSSLSIFSQTDLRLFLNSTAIASSTQLVKKHVRQCCRVLRVSSCWYGWGRFICRYANYSVWGSRVIETRSKIVIENTSITLNMMR